MTFWCKYFKSGANWTDFGAITTIFGAIQDKFEKTMIPYEGFHRFFAVSF